MALAAGLTAWAANARSVNSYFDSDAAIYKDSDSAALRAQQQRLLMQYDVFAAVYQFTQVSPPLPHTPPLSRHTSLITRLWPLADERKGREGGMKRDLEFL